MAAGHDPDAALVEKARAGDRAAFSALVRRHGAALLRLARVFVKDASAAEDVVHDTWIGALEGLDRFEGRAPFRAWLLRICANRARTRGARDARTPTFSALAREEAEGPGEDPLAGRFAPSGHWLEFPAAWDEDTPEAVVMRSETRQVLERAVAGLSESQRAVLTLRDLEGLSSEETCNLLAIQETHQRVLLHRARARVRAALHAHLAGEET